MPTRRHLLQAGGGLVAALAFPPLAVGASGTVEIVMQGRDNGAHVWFDPIGVRIEPGQSIRWTNRDPGNAHTTTAYHPSLFDRPQRIPLRAKAWNSDYLLPNESFAVALTEPGVYDFYCIPHEHAGMVGRIIVGMPRPEGDKSPESSGLTPVPQAALDAFPPIEEIMQKGIVRRA
jgi:plastocyanin